MSLFKVSAEYKFPATFTVEAKDEFEAREFIVKNIGSFARGPITWPVDDRITDYLIEPIAEVEVKEASKIGHAYTVLSSGGELLIDEAGYVTSFGVYDDDDDESRSYFKAILKIDLGEYKRFYGCLPEHKEFDILDVGYWLKCNTYSVPNVNFRKNEE